MKMNEAIAGSVYRAAAVCRGERTFRYLREYEKTQWMNEDDWERYGEERRAKLAAHLSLFIPYYRRLGVTGFSDLPVVARADLKESGDLFIDPLFDGKVSEKKTSGSTGEPVIVARDSEGLAREQAVTWRGYGWAGLKPGMRQARFWGIPLEFNARWRMNAKDWALNRKRFPVFNYTDETLEKYLGQLVRYSPHFLYGYVSALADFARFVLARGKIPRLPDLKAVVTTSEVLSEEARRDIEAALGVRVYNEYGCSELGTIAHECERGSLHLNAENLYVEVIGEDGVIRNRGRGRILVSEYYNRVQPLVRYELGDIGDLAPGACACGRSLPVIREIHGKAYDIIFGPNGRKYFPEYFSYLLKDIQGHGEKIRQFQIVQMDRDLLVNLVKGRDFHESLEREFQERLGREFGSFFNCKFTYMQRIPKEKSGKFRQVKRVAPSEPFPVG
jgi:phenylacetate-CoA ligase